MNVLDERGLCRVEIFFKHAPYEKRAFMSVVDVGAHVAVELAAGRDETPWPILNDAERADALTALADIVHRHEQGKAIRADDAERARTLLRALEGATTGVT